MYGGTKEEMQRLLEDASKLSGIEYDISSYADIVEAIHVIQDEMGIAGTTAKEASETISGSVASMGSAWKNLVTGIADKNADFKKLMSNFIESVKIVGKNLLPVVEQSLIGVGQLIEELFPLIVEALPRIINNILPKILQSGINIVNSLIGGITQNLPMIAQGAVDIIQLLLVSLITMLPEILDMGIKLIAELALGIAEMLPTLIPLAIEAIYNLVETLLDNIDLIIDAGIQLIIALTEGLVNSIPILVDKAPTIMFKLFDALIRNAPKIIGAGLEIILKLGKGILDNLFRIPEYIGKLWEKIKSAAEKSFGKITDIGKNLVKGLWEGIKSMGGWIKDKVGGFFGGISDGIKDIFGIKSPSRLFKYFGQMIDEGFVIGIEDGAKDIEKTMDKTFTFEEPKGLVDLSQMRGSIQPMSENRYLGFNQPSYMPQMVSQTKEQVVNFYQPVQTPDEISRKLRIDARLGMIG